MLNKERIRLMTKLAVYEQGEGKEYIPISRYRRKDYVAVQLIKTYICSTIAFGILFLLQILYEAETWLETLYQMDYQEYAIDILIQYLIFTAVYQAIAWVMYSRRYQKGQKNLKHYQSRLKKVEKLYEREEKLLPPEDREKM